MPTAEIPDEIATLLAALDAAPSHTAVLRTARDLARLAAGDGAGRTRCRIALVSNYTIKSVEPYLAVACARIGVAPDFYVSEYGQVEPDLLSPGGGLDAFDPDVTFLALGLDGRSPRTSRIPSGRATRPSAVRTRSPPPSP